MKHVSVFLMLLAFFALTARAQQSGAEQQDPMAALNALFGAAGTNQTVHHSQLKAMLPTEFAGMKRTNMEAGKLPALGFNISYAEAEYSTDDRSLQAKISDVGGMGKMLAYAQYAWLESEVERETDEGYERTTKIEGFPAQESYQTTDQSGNLQIMVDGRFMVELSGNGVEMATIKDLAKAINLNKLKDLKPQPAPAQ